MRDYTEGDFVQCVFNTVQNFGMFRSAYVPLRFKSFMDLKIYSPYVTTMQPPIYTEPENVVIVEEGDYSASYITLIQR